MRTVHRCHHRDDRQVEWSGKEINTEFTPRKKGKEEGTATSALWVEAQPIARSESARDRQQSTGQSRAQNSPSQMSPAAWTKVQGWSEEGQPSTQRGARRGGGLAEPWHTAYKHDLKMGQGLKGKRKP